MSYTLEVPHRIINGPDTIKLLGKEAALLGQHAAVLCTSRVAATPLMETMLGDLRAHGIKVEVIEAQSGEPTVDFAEQVLQRIEALSVDVIIGIGGGSVLDLAKIAAGLAFTGRLPIKNYFYGAKIEQKGLPWIAIPTTSGAGAEATLNAVLCDGDQVKQSIRGDRHWLAQLVLVDPQLTISCPPNVTAWSGMDALTQAIESHISKGANDLTKPYSAQATMLIARSLKRAYSKPDDLAARADMSTGSLMAGLALANARLGVVHGLAHPLGLFYDIPHGLVCGLLLPWSIEYNRAVCADAYAELASMIGVGDTAKSLESWVRSLNREFGIPDTLQSFGLKESDFDRIVEQSMPSGSLKANPRTVLKEDLYVFLHSQLAN